MTWSSSSKPGPLAVDPGPSGSNALGWCFSAVRLSVCGSGWLGRQVSVTAYEWSRLGSAALPVSTAYMDQPVFLGRDTSVSKSPDRHWHTQQAMLACPLHHPFQIEQQPVL